MCSKRALAASSVLGGKNSKEKVVGWAEKISRMCIIYPSIRMNGYIIAFYFIECQLGLRASSRSCTVNRLKAGLRTRGDCTMRRSLMLTCAVMFAAAILQSGEAVGQEVSPAVA